MLGLIGNLSLGETLVIAVFAVLIFGRRLPEVLGVAARELRKMRRAMDDVRRETGLDREMRSLRDTYRDTDREVRRAVEPSGERTPRAALAPTPLPEPRTTLPAPDPAPEDGAQE